MSPIRKARARLRLAATLLASTALAGAGSAFAESSSSNELIVTATKREENIQRVPMSIQALTGEKLEQLQVKDVNDYIKYLPSVSVQTFGPGFVDIHIRGVASGENNNHSGPLPTVGTYLDEAPISTIGGTLDIHVFDIARVESLSGPQGTLYGASSEAGTVRIITNKPKIGVSEAFDEVQINHVDHGGTGYMFNGMVNVPVNDKVAIRLVGWAEHDAGYIDNVKGSRTFPVSGITVNNNASAKDDYNDVEIYGARAALKIDLNENWTLTPSGIFQDEYVNGIFAYDPHVGELKVSHVFPEKSHDRWWQAALTVEGKVSNLDLVYAGSFMNRDLHVLSDYADYAYWYDVCCGYGIYAYDNNFNLIDPSQHITGKDTFTKQSHELRISTPRSNRFRFVGGLFYERQTHDISQRYIIDNFTSLFSVTGYPHTIWLTKQTRVDRDYAAFGEAAFDITDRLTLTGGLRVFKYDNSLVGFFGFNSNFSSKTGEAACFAPATVPGSPCTNLDKSVSDTGVTHKVNLTYKLDDQKLVYFTWSRGFRPGGINRRSDFPPYVADFLTNYEVGWKTTLAGGKVRFNGALFLDNWDNFQFSFLGANGLTNIRNAPQAELKGIEADLSWRPDDHWTVSAAGAFIDAKLTENFCQGLVNGLPVTNCATPEAPKGTRLPISPKFKGSGTVRYDFDLGDMMAHVQASVSGQTESWADLRVAERDILGPQRGYAVADFTAGVTRQGWNFELSLLNAFDERADIYKYAECATSVCGTQPYIITNRPRTIAAKIGKRF
jgi:iron complex outermembrane receptor protein